MVYNYFVDIKKKRNYYLIYTLIYCCFAALLLFLFYSKGRSLIDAGGDGYRQHFRSLLYYSNYLKKFFSNLLHGSFVLPEWDFVIGEGSDVLIALNYYCIGDIFTLLSVFFPGRYMYLCYDAITVIRIYFAGIAFSALCLYKKKKNLFIIMGCAFIYAFCPFVLSNLNAHVFFLSAAVYFPFIILGIEKIIEGEKPFSLMLSVFLASASNIYFFYMNVLSTVIYALVRMIFLKRSWKERFQITGKITLYSFIGVLMSGVIFFPMFYSMLFNNRFGAKIISDVFYSLTKYRGYYTGLAFKGYSFFGGFSVLGLLAIVELFCNRKEKYELKTLLIIAFIFACLPFFGKLYNAMVYPTNRWVYAISLLVCYITVDVFDDINVKTFVFWLHIGLTLFYYLSCVYLDQGQWQVHAMLLFMSLTVCASMKILKNQKLLNLLILGVALFSVFFNIIFDYCPLFWNKSEGGKLISEIWDMENDEHSVFNYIADDSFFRYSGNDLITNESVQGDKSSTQYYWSVVNDYVVEFRKDLGIADNSNHHYYDYDERFSLNALAGVKYFIDEHKGLIPEGFVYMGNFNNYDVYKSNSYLPLVYAYDNFILKDDWKKLDVASRNEIIAQAAVIENKKDLPVSDKLSVTHSEIDHTITSSGDIVLSDNQIISRNEGGTINVDCHYDKKGEYYLLIEGLDSEDSVNIDIAYGDLIKTIKYKGRINLHFTDRHDYLVNLGYMSGVDGTIALRFPGSSDFTYTAIKVIYQNLDEQKKAVEKLDRITIGDLKMGEDKISVEIEMLKDGIACFSIPYSKGWKAVVDGKEAELFNCNIQYMGVVLEKGVHTVELSYKRQLSVLGVLASIAGFAAFGCLWLKNRKYNKIF